MSREHPIKPVGPRSTPWLLIAALVWATSGCDRHPRAEVLTEVPWALTGQWLIADTHTHTRFSDGSYPLDEVVTRARANGCDVLAITDHADLSEDAATPEYFAAIVAARQRYPELILFGGIEWNVPPYNGREHVSVLLSPELEAAYLGEFKQRFEPSQATYEAALRWLSTQLPKAGDAVLIYNHPSRKDDNPSENAKDLMDWRQISDLVIGFEGAPGHQKANPIGSYKHRLATRDRWDPVVAEIGGIWDALLDQGHNVWAAFATSDFHNSGLDYEPCAFARTHIQVADRTAESVLRSLQAGSFWADHGRILDDLLMIVSAPGLPLPVSPGEVAQVERASPIHIGVALQRGAGAWGSPLEVELIGTGPAGRPELVAAVQLSPQDEKVEWTFTDLTPGGDGISAFFRIRVRKRVEDGPDLLAYSNPVRVILD